MTKMVPSINAGKAWALTVFKHRASLVAVATEVTLTESGFEFMVFSAPEVKITLPPVARLTKNAEARAYDALIAKLVADRLAVEEGAA